jgi:putative ABC transport system substrate-binding protein
MIGRRDFISLLGGAVAWPLAARAQQGERVRRIAGLFLQGPENRGVATGTDPIFTLWEELAKLGWIEGRNLRIDLRFAAAADLDRIKAYAMELVSLDPDVIVAIGTVSARVMQQQTRAIPIIFFKWRSGDLDALSHCGRTGTRHRLRGRQCRDWRRGEKHSAPRGQCHGHLR